MKNTVYFDESQCSSGKTSRINFNAANDLRRGISTLIIKPSIKAIEESHNTLISKGLSKEECVVIHSEKEGCTHLSKQILLSLDYPLPRIVLITKESFKNLLLLGVKNYPSWNLVMDEVVDVYSHVCNEFKENMIPAKQSILNLFDQDGGEAYKKITAKNISKVDDITKIFANVMRRAGSKFYDVYMTETESDAKLVVNFHIVLNSEVVNHFNATFLYAAKGSNSLQYHIWSKQGIKFTVMTHGRFEKHTGNLIVHHPNIKKFSHGFNTKCPEVKNFYINEFYDFIGNNSKYLFLDNNDTSFCHKDETRRVPHNTAGLNQYSDVSVIGCFSSLNPTSNEMMFIQHLYGITLATQMKLRHSECFYQTIMRGIMRSSGYKGEEMHVFVMSTQIAEWLNEFFHCIVVVEHDVETKLSVKIENKITPENRNKAYMIKKVHNLGKVKTKDLMNTKLWNACKHNGALKTEYLIYDVQTLLTTTGEKNV